MRYSLASRLIVLSALMVVLTVISLSAVVYYGFYNKIEAQVRMSLTEAAQFQANKIKTELNFEKTNVMSWRNGTVMADVIIDDLDKRIYTELLNLKKSYHLKGNLYVFNARKQLIASTQSDFWGETMPSVWRFHKANDVQLIAPHQARFETDKVIAFVSKLTPPGLPHQGYLVLTHPWTDIYQKLMSAPYVFAFYYPKNHVLERITATGVQPVTLKNPFDQQKNWLFDGQKYIGALSQLQQIGDFYFQIAAFMSKQKAREPQYALLKELNIVASIVIIPILLIVILMSRRFIRPIQTFINTIQKIEQNNDLTLTVPIDSNDEIADLAKVFNRLTNNLNKAFKERESISKQLEQLNNSLEEKVKQRTKDLETALDQLKSAQLKLVQSEKMNSLGQLVAGIAHEINNPVGAIYANVHPLKDYIHDLEESIMLAQRLLNGDNQQQFEAFLEQIDYQFMQQDLHDLVRSLQQSAERIKDIVLALRNFSRLDQGELKKVRLEEGIESTLNILHHEYKNRIKIEKDFQLNQDVECYAGELNQVFMNILANAIQAIPDKGHIRIQTYQQDQQAVVKISDDGPGIPDEIKARIFEPFFTTKEIGKGTGLGLSISYGIIEKHQGSLNVDSAPGGGAVFTIRIPLQMSKN